ncbi:DUF2182 domain-containing protein [Halorarius halobius]|uniref:DUF2182 domain-containing protein n=1 Tax=Halorarius halobius TaxID=2962671 RepID=UPI0020CE3695|nr:DUF2182 domain-containing protein [Halorarius halobius]
MMHPELLARLRSGGPRSVAVATYAVAGMAWLALFLHDPIEGAVGHAHGGSMTAADPGVFEAVALAGGPLGVLHYLAMWGLMMVAMMYPSSAGAFQWYTEVRAHLRPAEMLTGVAVFVGTYTLVWVAVGVVPLAVDAVVPIGSLAATWGALYFGVAFLAVAAFQLSPVKRRYLGRCRSPSGFLVSHYRPGLPGAVRLGWDFARQDVAACGVLMGLMVVVGSMNLGWMALITAVLTVERLTARGLVWARRFGALSGVAGLGLVGLWLW